MAERVEFLLEIGCEEIPASWLPGVTEQLAARFQEQAGAMFLEPLAVQSHSTPRRLVVRADLLARQKDREEDVWGPTLKVAKDAAGKWTKAAEGFAKKAGVALDALQQRAKDAKKPDEINLLFVKATPGAPAADVLGGALASVLRSLAFPKRMSWDAWLEDGKGVFPFGRPIRWLVTLLGGKVVPFTIYELVGGAKGPAIVQSGETTRGHRFLPRGRAGQPVRVTSFADLKDKLRANGTLLDVAERRARIQAGLEQHGVRLGSHADHGLLDEWPQLVEHPTVVVGEVPQEFRALPVEVLETVLVHHQKYIPVHEGGQVTRFAAVTDIDEEPSATIVRGMQRVCVARFRDAAFFYGEDRKRTLALRVDDLTGVMFHQKLGTYRAKAERMVKLVDHMQAAGWLTAEQHQQAAQAALLAKADLTTGMVREFTELQGVIGGVYLEQEGAAPAVAAAVRWHYHPIAMGENDAPTQAQVGDPAVFGAVALADKLDTLAAYFSIGLQPTGSSDPFGLRRAAQGVIRILADYWPAPDLNALLEHALVLNGSTDPVVRGRLAAFLFERFASVFVTRGFPLPQVNAVEPTADSGGVVASSRFRALESVNDAKLRLRALHDTIDAFPADFAALAETFKRVNNILAGQPASGQVEPSRFQQASERELHAALENARTGQHGHDYAARLRALAKLREPIDRFFAREQDGGVLVMADDPAVRANRLALLAQARELFHRIADISRLGGTQ